MGVTPATLKRWADSGVIPNLNGSRDVAAGGGLARAHRRADARARAQPRAHPPGRGAGPARLRLHRRTCSPTSSRPARSKEVAELTGLEPALIERFWAGIGLPAGGPRAHERGRHAGGPVRGVGARRRVPARGVPPALPRVRPGALPDRRRRGAPLPPLRARAADARGGAGARDGRGDGGAGARPAAALLAAHGLRAPALPPALRGAGRGRSHGDGHGGRGRGPRAGARGDRLRRPGRLHALHRGGGRGGGALVGRALRGGRDQHAARRRPGGQDDRRRGDGGGPGRARARGLGGGLRGDVRRASRAAHRHPLRTHALPRRRLLRPRGQPRVARGRAGARRRGAAHRLRARCGAALHPPARSSRSGR